MVTTKPSAPAGELRHLAVPPAWAGLRHVWVYAWLALVVTVVVAGWAFTQGALALELETVAIGVWLFLLGTWLGRPTLSIGPASPVVALTCWTVLCTAAAWWQGWRAAAVAVVIAYGAAVVIGGRALAAHTRKARRMLWLAQGLGPATADTRPATAILHPTWSTPDGLPVRWAYPSALTPTDKRLAELEAVAATRLGKPVRITWGAGQAVIDARTTAPAATDLDPVAERITAVLAAMIPGAKVTALTYDADGRPDHLAFTWPPERAVRVTPTAYRARVSRSLQGALGFPINVRWDIAADRADVAPVPELPTAIPHPPRNEHDPWKVQFGQFRGGGTCVWDLNSTLPHVLIVGGTGGGKTVLMLSLLTSLPQTETVHTDVHLIDPKRVGFKGVAGRVPGVRKPATTPAAFIDTLQTVQEEMDRRYSALEDDRTTRDELQPIVLFIDEGQEMYDVLKTWWVSGEGKEDWKRRFDLDKAPTGSEHPAMGMLGSILRLGREARVHVVLASQQAAATWLQTSSRGQFAVRIALRNLSVDDSRMVFGSPVATAGLENTPGRAWVSTGLGAEPQHAQIYWTPKIERNLPPADRAILHGLGITLPDDEDTTDVDAVIVSTEPAPQLELITPGGMSPQPAAGELLAPTVDERPAPGAGAIDHVATTDTPVTAIEDGDHVVIDTDDGPALAVVETVDPDDTDPDCLAVTYRLPDGELGVISLPDDETLAVVTA